MTFEPQPIKESQGINSKFNGLPTFHNRRFKQEPESNIIKCPEYNAKLLMMSRTRKISTEMRNDNQNIPTVKITNILELSMNTLKQLSWNVPASSYKHSWGQKKGK